MKTNLGKWLIISIMFCAVGLFSCEEKEEKVAVTSVEVDPDQVSFVVGDTRVVTVTVLPEEAANKEVTWSSSDETVMTVADGTLTAVKEGVAVATVTSVADITKKATVNIIVTPFVVPVESVTVNPDEVSLFVGETADLVLEVLPVEATNKEVTWSSSDDVVASVEDLEITANAAGTATITATSVADPLKKATVTVTVTVPPSILVTETFVSLKDEGEFTLEIEANIPFEYELPTWIHAKIGNTPATGTQTYVFTVDALPSGGHMENLVIKSTDAALNVSVSIPVIQVESSLTAISRYGTARAEGINADEGHSLNNSLGWWNGDDYVWVEGNKFTYHVYVAEDGIYEFQILHWTWETGSTMNLYVDNVLSGQVEQPPIDQLFAQYPSTDPRYYDEASYMLIIERVALTAGVHTIVFRPTKGGGANSHYTIAYKEPYAPIDLSPVITNSAPTEIPVDRSLELYDYVNYPTTTYAAWIFDSRRNIVNVHNGVFTFDVNVQDAGDYNVKVRYRRWCSPRPACLVGTDVKLYIDNVDKGHTGELHHIDEYDLGLNSRKPEQAILETITLPAGKHTLKFETPYLTDFVFGWFTVTAE
jgi:hypothetical protein